MEALENRGTKTPAQILHNFLQKLPAINRLPRKHQPELNHAFQTAQFGTRVGKAGLALLLRIPLKLPALGRDDSLSMDSTQDRPTAQGSKVGLKRAD